MKDGLPGYPLLNPGDLAAVRAIMDAWVCGEGRAIGGRRFYGPDRIRSYVRGQMDYSMALCWKARRDGVTD